MNPVILIFAFLFGAVVGSFMNVCIYRLPRGESLILPGSRCPLCGSGIRSYDNIPILSYLLLRGRCRECGGRIDIHYLLVETISGILCLWAALRYGFGVGFWIYYPLLCALVVATFIDLQHKIIPNRITYPGILVGLLISPFHPRLGLLGSLMGILLGGGVLLGVALAFRWLRKKEGMGMGDVKLLAMIGGFLGWKGVIFTLISASLLGSLVGTLVILISGKGSEYPIPFGPFISLGAFLYIVLGEVLLRVLWGI